MLKDKIGFIGIGQCGGNIVKNFEDNGYSCLFINSSEKDLDTIHARYKTHIPNAFGCSKQRDKAIMQTKKHYRLIVSEVADKLQDQEFIYIVTSTGGGSGSGMTPILLDILIASLPQKDFGCIVAIPSKKETVQTQINSVMFFQQILQVEGLKSTIVLDNEKDNKFVINNIFYQLFDDMLKIPNNISELGNLDESEILQMMNTQGCLTISGTNKCNTSTLIQSISDNIYAPIEKDKEIQYLGLSLMDDIDTNDIIRYVGTPLDTFHGYNNTRAILILCGLSYPMTRINEMNNIAKGNKDILFKSKSKVKVNIDTGWFGNEVGRNLEEATEVDSLDELFAKY